MPICGICFQGDTAVVIQENIGLLLSLNPKHSLYHRKKVVGRPHDEGARLSCSFPAEWPDPFFFFMPPIEVAGAQRRNDCKVFLGV